MKLGREGNVLEARGGLGGRLKFPLLATLEVWEEEPWSLLVSGERRGGVLWGGGSKYVSVKMT
jgi:hypothetical protein